VKVRLNVPRPFFPVHQTVAPLLFCFDNNSPESDFPDFPQPNPGVLLVITLELMDRGQIRPIFIASRVVLFSVIYF